MPTISRATAHLIPLFWKSQCKRPRNLNRKSLSSKTQSQPIERLPFYFIPISQSLERSSAIIKKKNILKKTRTEKYYSSNWKKHLYYWG